MAGTQTIKWYPATTPNVIAYEIWHSDNGKTGDYSLLAQVLHQIPGSNYDNEGGCFSYVDTEVSYRWYKLKILDRYGNNAEDDAPTPFKAGNEPIEAPQLHYVALDHNYHSTNLYQYISEGGTPIEEATVRVYRKIDYDTNNLSVVVGSTITTATGGWKSPVFVEPGETYTIVYNKVNAYGPDTAEVIV